MRRAARLSAGSGCLCYIWLTRCGLESRGCAEGLGAAMSGKFGIIAAAIILAAALAGGIRDIFGGDMRRSLTASAQQETTGAAPSTAEQIEGDYDAAVKTVTDNY